MVVNDPKWRIVAAQVAKDGLSAYFKSQQAIKKQTAQKKKKATNIRHSELN